MQLLEKFRVSIIHLSDEEGLDGDSFYSKLAPGTTIYRNFFHQRFSRLDLNIYSFPIGPRDIFLPTFDHSNSYELVSREYPWAFMGTLWTSGSRNVAVSTFLRSLPEGYYYGGKSFGQGLPLVDYRNILLNSHFALAPEGDRHLDTFRLWESLCCGCIPVVVDSENTVHDLLPNYPLPIYSSWHTAMKDVQDVIWNSPSSLPILHHQSQEWWLSHIALLRSKISNYSSDS